VGAAHSLDDIAQTLFTAVLSDVLDTVGCTGQVASPGIRPLADGMRVVGYARTARAVMVSRPPTHPYAKILEVIDDLSENDVLVMSLEPMSRSAIFGGLLATAVSVTGARGVIVDGHIRDSDEIKQIGLPTFARDLMPLDSHGRDEVVAVDEPVCISGVPVASGDLVFGDADGIVIVPKGILDNVLTLAFEKVSGESRVRQSLREGMSTTAAFARYGIL
jgi:4-hydroxy-4-methyl-2-oxoglutarate aldolase